MGKCGQQIPRDVWKNGSMSDSHLELGKFLRKARESLNPEQSGLLPDGRIRRVPGLRREEVALLAGVSTDYYIRLEQGRNLTPSAQVIDALIRALNLDSASQSYFRALVAPTSRSRTRPKAQRVRSGLYQLLDTLSLQPALILGHRTDILASNTLARALFADFEKFPAKHRNYVRWIMLDEDARVLFLDWEEQARNAVEALRLEAAMMPNDHGLQQLIGELSLASAEFQRWWSERRVYQRTYGTKHLRHPIVGDLDVQFETFGLPGDSSQLLYIYTTEPGTTSQQALGMLASWAQSTSADTQ